MALAEGLAAANRAIELDRSDHEVGVRAPLNLFAARSDRTGPALDDARRAHELNPNDYRALHQLGSIEMLHGDHHGAIEHLLQAIRLNPRDPLTFSVYASLADACFYLCDYARGLEFGLRAVAEARGGGTTWHNVALCYVALGEMEKARTALDNARRSAPKWIENALSGSTVLRRPEDRRKYRLFLRIAAGLEDPGAADPLRCA